MKKWLVLLLVITSCAACKTAELEECKNQKTACENQKADFAQGLQICEGRAGVLYGLCDEFQEAHQNESASYSDLIGENEYTTLETVFNSDVSAKLIKVDLTYNWAYIQYKVGEDVRQSDRLVFNGDKDDRSSLFIQDAGNPLLLWVEGCESENSCTLGYKAFGKAGLAPESCSVE